MINVRDQPRALRSQVYEEIAVRDHRPHASPYENFREADLIVRDHLALDRTQLANERTLLAYLRSGVALILSGVTLFHFARTPWLEWVGLACLPLGGITLVFGCWRFAATARRLRRFKASGAGAAVQESEK